MRGHRKLDPVHEAARQKVNEQKARIARHLVTLKSLKARGEPIVVLEDRIAVMRHELVDLEQQLAKLSEMQ